MICFEVCVYGFNDEPACYKELMTDFFNPAIVSQTLSLYFTSQSSWQMIVYELQKQSRENAATIITYKAQRMRPNPLEYPFNQKVAAKLLFETLFDIFTQAFKGYNIFQQFNDIDYKNMFNEIKRKQRDKLIRCFGEDFEETEEAGQRAKR